MPDTTRMLGKVAAKLFNGNNPTIIFDGFVDPSADPEAGRICLQNNGEITFANMDVPGGFKNVSMDISKYDCSLSPLTAANL